MIVVSLCVSTIIIIRIRIRIRIIIILIIIIIYIIGYSSFQKVLEFPVTSIAESIVSSDITGDGNDRLRDSATNSINSARG